MSADPAPLPGLQLDPEPEPPAEGLRLARCRACGHPLRDRLSRWYGLGPDCRAKLLRIAPRPPERDVEQETLPGW